VAVPQPMLDAEAGQPMLTVIVATRRGMSQGRERFQ